MDGNFGGTNLWSIDNLQIIYEGVFLCILYRGFYSKVLCDSNSNGFSNRKIEPKYIINWQKWYLKFKLKGEFREGVYTPVKAQKKTKSHLSEGFKFSREVWKLKQYTVAQLFFMRI